MEAPHKEEGLATHERIEGVVFEDENGRLEIL
jgi:hypothetical protein